LKLQRQSLIAPSTIGGSNVLAVCPQKQTVFTVIDYVESVSPSYCARIALSAFTDSCRVPRTRAESLHT